MTTSDDNELARMYLEMEMYRNRYETVRKLTPRQFADLYQRNLNGEGTFDDIVDKEWLGKQEGGIK
jgi:hypothetical protein